MSHGVLISTALALLALAAGLGAALLFGSSRMQRSQRVVDTMIEARRTSPEAAADRQAVPVTLRERLLHLIASVGRYFEGGSLQKLLIAPEDRLLLGLAGWNTSTGTAIFLGLRVVTALLFSVLAILLAPNGGLQGMLVWGGGFALGLLLPKFALGYWAGRLRRQAYNELPLLIDLVRLLQGVGFSMDQSLHTLGDKLRPALPLLGRELQDANVAYTRGRSRAQSLQRLSEGYDDEDLRSLIQIVLQVHEHGGPVQEPLKQFSVRLREQRRMRMKEQIGKLSVKMTMVMMLTLLPALMLILAGPAIIALANALTGIRP